MKVKLGFKVISVLEIWKMFSQEFYWRIGGILCIQMWIVMGNLLVLQYVQKFLKDFVEEFERLKIFEIWLNVEYYLMGVFYMQFLQVLFIIFKIVCWLFDNVGFFGFIYYYYMVFIFGL